MTTTANSPFAAFADEEPTKESPFAAFAEEAPEEPEVIDGETVEDETATPALTMDEWREVSEIFTLQDMLNKAIADFTKKRRANMDTFVERAAETFSTDQLKVEPELVKGGRQLIGKISVKRTSASTAVDEETFFAWCKENRPDLIVTETVPAKPEQIIEAVPEHTVERLRIGAAETVIEKANHDEDGTIIDENGVPVEGLVHNEGGDYNGFTITYGTKRKLAEEGLRTLFQHGFKMRETEQIVAQAQLEQAQK